MDGIDAELARAQDERWKLEEALAAGAPMGVSSVTFDKDLNGGGASGPDRFAGYDTSIPASIEDDAPEDEPSAPAPNPAARRLASYTGHALAAADIPRSSEDDDGVPAKRSQRVIDREDDYRPGRGTCSSPPTPGRCAPTTSPPHASCSTKSRTATPSPGTPSSVPTCAVGSWATLRSCSARCHSGTPAEPLQSATNERYRGAMVPGRVQVDEARWNQLESYISVIILLPLEAHDENLQRSRIWITELPFIRNH